MMVGLLSAWHDAIDELHRLRECRELVLLRDGLSVVLPARKCGQPLLNLVTRKDRHTCLLTAQSIKTTITRPLTYPVIRFTIAVVAPARRPDSRAPPQSP